MARSLLSEHPSLTPPLTSLIGRQNEVAHLIGMLSQPGIRLITLTGPGGIGKTRLALAVAEQFHARNAEGIVAIASLAPLANHELLLPTIARALGLSEHAEQTALERLSTYLQQREALVVLDNVEHLLEAAPEIAELLSYCPPLRILATGREPLHLHGERQFPVSHLSLPEPNAQISRTSIQHSDAVRLFVERAKDVAPDFRVTDANAAKVAEISRRLDGVPLALELAAARMKVVSPGELLVRLDDPLVLLAGGPQNVPARQRTMREVVQWSYDLLSAEEQRLFRHLSVFAGGFSLPAVEAVSDREGAMERLTSLVDKSLVQRTDHGAGESRYGMLEPVRQFAFELLLEDEDEANRVRQQHALYYLSTAGRLSSGFDGPEGAILFRQVAIDHDNMRVALRWFGESGQAELGLELVGELGIFWHQFGFIREGRAQAEKFLDLTSSMPRTGAWARAYWAVSWLWANSLAPSDIKTALRLNSEACAIAEANGVQFYWANARFVWGICHMRLGDHERARCAFEESLRVFRNFDDSAKIVRVLTHLAALARRAGEFGHSRSLIEEALTLADQCHLTMVTGPALGALAMLEERAGNDKRAAELYRERLELYREFGIPRGIAETLEYVGFLVRRHRQSEEAVALFALASVYRERSSTHYYNVMDAPDLDAELRALRTELSEVAFQSAWKRGLNGSVDDAIEVLTSLVDSDATNLRTESTAGLTPREIDVLSRIAAGRSNREIAEDLFISTRTVERHIENIYRKLDIHSRADAIEFGRSHLG